MPTSEDLRLIRFQDPVPTRRIAMFWRRTSAYREFLPQVAELFRQLPDGLVDTSMPDGLPEVSDALLAPTAAG